MLSPALVDRYFPNLKGLHEIGYWLTSDPTVNYNCIAWAAGDKSQWWWPEGRRYWPLLNREVTIPNFIAAFNGLGYEVTDNSDLETDYEKVALYALGQDPTHMARQLLNGFWTSKLGEEDDIVHVDVRGVENDIYGKVILFLKRRGIAQSTI